MQLNIGVELTDGQDFRNHTSMEPKISMMIVPCDLDYDLVCIPNKY